MVFSNKKLKELFFKSGLFRASHRVERERPFLEKHGIMPDLSSKGPSAENYFYMSPLPEDDQIGTSAFDLRVGRNIACSDTALDKITESDLMDMHLENLNLGDEFVLENDRNGRKFNYITSFEIVKLSDDLEMVIDSKSTTGRVGGMSHGVNQRTSRHMITMIQPYAFPLKVTCGKTRLSQAVVRYTGTPYMTKKEILESQDISFEGKGLSLEDCLTEKGLIMYFDPSIVYKAKSCDIPIDMDVNGTLDWRPYFELIEGNSQMIIEPNVLYLIGAKGVISLGAVCGLLSREDEVHTGTGTWGHFAGIFQPGYKGGITMEVFSHTKRRITSDTRAGIVTFDKIDGELESGYKGSYQYQKPPRLPRMFKQAS